MRVPRSAWLLSMAVAAGAVAQQYEWRQASEPAFAAGGNAQFAYDTARKRMIALVGAQTWEGDGAVWHLRGAVPLGALQHPAMAFDRARGVTVLFGGSGTGGYNAQTLIWNGSSWRSAAPATSPTGRWFSPLAYDTTRQRIVLFGGETQAGIGNDTWEFDGTNWQLLAPPVSPGPRGRIGLAYDESRQVTVMFGGIVPGSSATLDETWEWNGATWTQRFPAVRPPARRNHGMAYDAARARTVVLGGYVGANLASDTWEYDGVLWRQVLPAQPAPPRQVAQSLGADPERGEVVCLEGSLGQMRTWVFDGARWRIALQPATSETRDEHAMAHDPVRGETLVFGNGGLLGYPSFVASTWLHRGGVWTQQFPSLSPPFTSQPAMAHDPAGGGIVLFGGNPGAWSATTWRWNGTGWQVLPGAGPPGRSGAAMSSDRARGRIVLFGGESAGGLLGDTWEWNGTAWSQRAVAAAPPPREGHAMTWDARRGRTVLFGGGDLLAPPTLGDHWEWDGASWTQITATLPPARSQHSLVFDTVAQQVLMLGGRFLVAPALPAPRNDLWYWDGVVWTPRAQPQPMPPNRTTAVAVHDSVLARTLLFGGGFDVDAWLLGPQSTAAATAFGSGCNGRFGVPELRAEGQPLVGNRWLQLRASALAPTGFGLVGLGLRSTSLPLPGGCALLVDAVHWGAGVADPRGTFVVPLPIPAQASLRGVNVFAQALAIDPNGAFANLAAFSAGVQIALD